MAGQPDNPSDESSRELYVVGVDDSQAAAGALRWAVEQASRLGAQVRAVHVYRSTPRGSWVVGGHPGLGPPDPSAIVTAAERTAATAVRRCFGEQAPAFLSTSVLEGSSAPTVLVEQARHASLLVVGARPMTGVRHALGSTALACIQHAPCPVVVVPGGE